MTNDTRTPEERAEENRKASAEAMRLATEQQQRDIESGQKPVASEVAEGLKKRLEQEDFSQKDVSSV